MTPRYQELVDRIGQSLRTLETSGTLQVPAGELVPSAAAPDSALVARIRQEAAACTACALGPMRLARSRTSSMRRSSGHIVPGEGPVPALVFAVADRPGQAEDESGRPIVGPTAAAFDQVLAFLGLDRKRDVFVTNSVKCMPPGVREPNKTEWCRCSGRFLHRQIRAVQPRLIIAFGGTAFDAVMQSPDKPDADPKHCRGAFSSASNFDEHAHRLLDYPLDDTIKVWWTRHYAAQVHDNRDRVRWTEQLEPLRLTLRQFRQRPRG